MHTEFYHITNNLKVERLDAPATYTHYLTEFVHWVLLMPSKQSGFTLLEMLVVMVIMGVMAAIALPNFTQWVATSRVANKTDQVINLMRFARSEAIRLNQIVYVCNAQIRADGKPDNYCNNTYQGQGMVAFSDANRDGRFASADGDRLLRTAVLNNSTTGQQVAINISNLRANGQADTVQARQFGFMPDGNVVRIDANLNRHSLTGPVQITLTDAKASSTAQKTARAYVVLLEPGGRGRSCNMRTEKDKNSIFCKPQF